MIYTGNNGRIYIARSQSSGLTGTFTVNVPTGSSVVVNGVYQVRNIVGDGRSAAVRADRTVNTTQASRQCVFTVVSAGANYEAGDVVRFYYVDNKKNIIDVSPNVGINTTATRGVDSEREILDDQYRIAKIRSWSLTSNSEIIETTALGDTVRTVSPGMTSGEGSATLLFYEDEINDNQASRQKDTFELVDILFPRGTAPRVILNLAVDGSVSGTAGDVGGAALWKTNFLFNAFITSASMGVSYGEVVTIDTSFTIDGAFLDVPWKPNVSRL
jgi:hypothetical protein